MSVGPAANGGTVLLVLTGRDAQSVAQLAAASGLSPGETIRQLQSLTRHGFIIAGSPDAEGVSIYRLNPKGVRTDELGPHQRILVVDDADALRRLMQIILEDEGYAVITTAVQEDAVVLLREVAFDLVITDSFSQRLSGAFLNTAEVLEAAEATPVALFSAHRMELAPAQAAGFRDLIAKPFDIDVLSRQVRALLTI
ncbi:MAG TPA: response regulator [Dehalococcoidia bacterium]|nr:response regulator [Dehalococcoidia bacterium]